MNADLSNRVGVLHYSPTWGSMSEADRAAFNARVVEVDDWSELSEADRELCRRGALEVSAGQAPILHPDEWGDWQAIDAALDSGDQAALDVALGTVGVRGDVRRALADQAAAEAVPDDELDDDGFPPAPAGEAKAYDELEGLDPDADEWVGV